MASSARIEELERKFNENPRRYFAPLANEYRKAGDLEQAIAICRTYVPQQPAHMSGHIVFGQALFEAGEHEEARGVFEAALALDPENLIALRHLGDIARERGEATAARTWYQRVLDADPRNDEVSALIASLNGPAASPPPPTPPPPSPNVPTWAEINPERTLELPPELIESAKRDVVIGEAHPPRDVTPAIPPPTMEPAAPFASAVDQTLQPPPPAMPRAGWLHEPPVLADEIAGAGLVGMEPMDGAVTLPPPASVRAAPSTVPPETDRSPVDTVDKATVVRDAVERPSGPVSEPELDQASVGLEPMEFVAPPRPEPPARAEEEVSPPAVEASGVAAAEETPAVFVTETMAELYLQQGFRDEALSVYRQLLAQSPGDALLRERVEQLEHVAAPSDAGLTVSRSFTVPDAPAAEAIGPPPLTVRAFFAGLASRPWSGRGAESSPVVDAVPSASHETGGEAPSASASAAATPESGSTAGHEAVATDARLSGVAVSETMTASAFGVAVADASTSDVIESVEVEMTHSVSVESTTYEAGFSDAGIVADDEPTPPSVSSVEATQYDVASYDAADMSGTLPPAVAPPQAPAPPSAVAEADVGPETSAPAAVFAGGASVDHEPPVETSEINGMGPGAAPRKPMQTGSVNVLFPQQPVRPADETAAATLSDAFGGPTQPGAPSVGHPARPATNELSLDSIFREAGPPAEPRRESSAFSFDQFFTDTSGSGSGSAGGTSPGAAPPREGTSSNAADALSNDAEQFSTWLAGLKKK